jgi:Sec7-like guanine-nucleotide exchange factor
MPPKAKKAVMQGLVIDSLVQILPQEKISQSETTVYTLQKFQKDIQQVNPNSDKNDTNVEAKQTVSRALTEQLQQHRHNDLVRMQTYFESEMYHQKQRDFVYKSSGNLSCKAELNRPLKQTGDSVDQPKNHCSFKSLTTAC